MYTQVYGEGLTRARGEADSQNATELIGMLWLKNNRESMKKA